MRILDLFCGAGGAAMGYHQAFPDAEIVGVDIAPQPHFPFEFHQGDAMTWPLDGFDLIHASPPCQNYTTMSNRHRGNGGAADQWPDLIAPARARLVASATPFVIENVVGASRQMATTLVLNGRMFGLGVWRPRLFECSFLIMGQPVGSPSGQEVGVYGKLDGRRLWSRKDGSELRNPRSLREGQEAMGIDWMEWRELAESIPPAYTRYIGEQFAAMVPA